MTTQRCQYVLWALLLCCASSAAHADWLYREVRVQGWTCRLEVWVTDAASGEAVLASALAQVSAVAMAAEPGAPVSDVLRRLQQQVQAYSSATGGVVLDQTLLARGYAADLALEALQAQGAIHARVEVDDVGRVAADRFGKPWIIALAARQPRSVPLVQRAYGRTRDLTVVAGTGLRAAVMASLADTLGVPAVQSLLQKLGDTTAAVITADDRVLRGTGPPLNVQSWLNNR